MRRVYSPAFSSRLSSRSSGSRNSCSFLNRASDWGAAADPATLTPDPASRRRKGQEGDEVRGQRRRPARGDGGTVMSPRDTKKRDVTVQR
jgi:hypothetical protein